MYKGLGLLAFRVSGVGPVLGLGLYGFWNRRLGRRQKQDVRVRATNHRNVMQGPLRRRIGFWAASCANYVSTVGGCCA